VRLISLPNLHPALMSELESEDITSRTASAWPCVKITEIMGVVYCHCQQLIGKSECRYVLARAEGWQEWKHRWARAHGNDS
jgi:hypothetical protein